MFHGESLAGGCFCDRTVLSFSCKILADLATRGCAISFLTLAFVAISILLLFFFRKIHPL